MTSLRVNVVSHEIRSANLTGAMGITTLDGLGVGGGGQHTLEEHINIESLALRGRLLAGLLSGIG
jgi:glutamate carboxypeptidase